MFTTEKLPRLGRNIVISHGGQALTWCMCIGIILLAAAAFLKWHFVGKTFGAFGDEAVYVATVEAQARGLDPYDLGVQRLLGVIPTNFVNSPPAATWLLGIFGIGPLRRIFPEILLGSHLISLPVLVVSLGNIFFGTSILCRLLAFACFLALFAAGGLFMFDTGNLAMLLHALMAASLSRGLLLRRWRLFYIALMFSSLFKPIYLAYALMPAASYGWSWLQAKRGALATALVATAYLFTVWMAPKETGEWLANLRMATFIAGDLGLNIYSGARRLLATSDSFILFSVQACFCGLLLAGALLVRNHDRRRWAALLVAVIYVNPRMMFYDVAIAAIPLTYLFSELLPKRLSSEVRLGASVGILGAVHILAFRSILVPPDILFPLTTLTILWFSVIRDEAARLRFVLP